MRWLDQGRHGHQWVMMYSTSASEPPLMMPPANATSGLTQPVACSASLARGLSCLTSGIAAPPACQDRSHGAGDIVEFDANVFIRRMIGRNREITRLEIGGREMLGIGQRVP